MKTTITLTIDHKSLIPDLLDKIAGRAYTLSGVDGVTAGLETIFQWLPIDSAPKDGTEILLGHQDGSLAVAYWSGTCFIEGDFNCDWATHWKPKPPAPNDD